MHVTLNCLNMHKKVAKKNRPLMVGLNGSCAMKK